jgi:sec-independent protein translocase protein TatB
MFDISFLELAIIFIVTLLVVGPEKLPELVRDVGRWVRKLRRVVIETQYEFEREFTFEEEKKRLREQGKDLSGAIDELDELMSIAPDKDSDFKAQGPAENEAPDTSDQASGNKASSPTAEKT